VKLKQSELFQKGTLSTPSKIYAVDAYQGAYVRGNDEPRPLKGRLERLLKEFRGEEIVQELKAMASCRVVFRLCAFLRTDHGAGSRVSLLTNGAYSVYQIA
jgi:hypothetical protein